MKKLVSILMVAAFLAVLAPVAVDVAYAACIKAPAPVAVNGLSVAIPPSQSVMMFYADFLATPTVPAPECSLLWFGFADNAGKVSQGPTEALSLEFTCADANMVREIEIAACSEFGCDYAITFLDVQDPNQYCGDTDPAPTVQPWPILFTVPSTPTPTPTGSPAFPSGAFACWSMNEASGVRADSVAGYDLADMNGVGSATGKIGSAASFDGVSGQKLVGTGASAIDMSDGVTVSYWKKQSSYSGDSWGDFVFGSDFGQSGGGFYSGDVGSLTNSYFAGAGVDMTVYPPQPYAQAQGASANGDWQHVIAWYDPSDLKTHITVNGVAELSGFSNLTTHPVLSGNQLVVGKDWYGFSNGSIDEVAVWNRVLTAAERAALYNGGAGFACPGAATPTPTPSPVGDYKDILTFSLQTIGQGPASFRGIEDAELRVYDIADPAFVGAYGASFASWKSKLHLIYTGGVGQIAACTTDADGACIAYKAAAGNYLVVGSYVDNDEGKTVYVSKNELAADFNADKENFADLKIIKKYDKSGNAEYGPGGQVVVTTTIASANSGFLHARIGAMTVESVMWLVIGAVLMWVVMNRDRIFKKSQS